MLVLLMLNMEVIKIRVPSILMLLYALWMLLVVNVCQIPLRVLPLLLLVFLKASVCLILLLLVNLHLIGKIGINNGHEIEVVSNLISLHLFAGFFYDTPLVGLPFRASPFYDLFLFCCVLFVFVFGLIEKSDKSNHPTFALCRAKSYLERALYLSAFNFVLTYRL